MSYQVLARKWRPKAFTDMVGQEHVLKALINALDQGRLHHAYLFTGTRGVGKTTIARILAKCLNCEQGVSSKPCGQCGACQGIDEGRFIDLLEVDAASRTKVEDTRELLENVQYAPTSGRYKVYLIDEVHMLSGHSFNALLKTLEEPPPHVKFLLATTDPQKLPVTVLSRCLQFNLKNLAPELIQQHCQFVLEQEQVSFESDALMELATAADGSMRDALSLLDQAIAFGNGQVNTKDIHSMLGTIAKDHVYALLQALSQQNAAELLDISAKLAERGTDFNNALESLLSLLHQISICQSIPAMAADTPELIQSLAQQLTPEDIHLFYQIALIGRRDLPLAPSAKIGFEMVLLRMLAFRPAGKVAPPTPPPGKSEPKPELTPAPTSSTTPVQQQNNETVDAIKSTPEVNLELQSNQDENWDEMLKKLKLTGMSYALASHCCLKSQLDNQVQLLLDPSQAPILNDMQQKRLQQALEVYYNKPVVLTIELAKTAIESPASKQQLQKNQQQQAAVSAIEGDAHVQSLLQSFNGIIDSESIKALTTEEI